MIIAKFMVPKNQLVTLRPGDTVQSAVEKMADHGVNAVIIEKGSSVVGIVTSRDIMRSISGKKSAALKEPLDSIMSKKLITIRPSRQTSDAIIKMKEEKIHHLLVEDENMNIVGIISSFDLVREKALDQEAHPWIRN